MSNKRLKFAQKFEDAIVIVDERIAHYNSSDLISLNKLLFLRDALNKKKIEVLAQNIEANSGQLFGPIKSVIDWGEPADSKLTDSIYQIEIFYRDNY